MGWYTWFVLVGDASCGVSVVLYVFGVLGVWFGEFVGDPLEDLWGDLWGILGGTLARGELGYVLT